MPSRNTYRLTSVSLTLDVGYLFTAASAKCSRCSLPWRRGISTQPPPPDLERGVAPLGPPVPAQLLLLGHGVAPLGHKAFDCVDHNKLWKILKEMGIPDHLTCLLRNLYAGQEATVRTDWFQIGKGVCQGCILSPCLFNLYA